MDENKERLITFSDRLSMKKILGLTMGVVCLAASISAQATTVAQLVVRGTITPGACNLSLGDGGIIDYGRILSGELSQTAFNPRAEMTTSVVVNCGTTPARFGLTVTDLQAGSKVTGILGAGYTEAQNFGLGATNARRTGGYSVTIRDLRASGVVLNPIMRVGTGAWQNSDGKVAQEPSQYSWRNSTTVAPALITQMNGVLAVRAVLNRGADLDLTRDVTLDGRATLELGYL